MSHKRCHFLHSETQLRRFSFSTLFFRHKAKYFRVRCTGIYERGQGEYKMAACLWRTAQKDHAFFRLLASLPEVVMLLRHVQSILCAGMPSMQPIPCAGTLADFSGHALFISLVSKSKKKKARRQNQCERFLLPFLSLLMCLCVCANACECVLFCR